MTNTLSLTTAFATVLCIVTSNGEVGYVNSYVYNSGRPAFTYGISQNSDILTTSEIIANEIESEIDGLHMDTYDKLVQDSFVNSAGQLKNLLTNESIKKMPDVLMFHKGYVGLVWEGKEDESIFVYSIPDGTLFFNRIGINFSETRKIIASKGLFSGLIKEINAMV